MSPLLQINFTSRQTSVNMYNIRAILIVMYVSGIKKCGTTDLFSRISAHPDFKSSGFKESQWFTRVRYNITFAKRNSSFWLKAGTLLRLLFKDTIAVTAH